MTRIELRPCDGAGVEILGIDLNTLSADEDRTIRGAFAEYGVVFFRDQSLTEDEHIRFARRFGDININRFFTPHPEHPEIAAVPPLYGFEQLSGINGCLTQSLGGSSVYPRASR